MSNAMTTAFAPLIGLPCLGLRRGHGSILSFEFGSPHLLIREPYASTSSSARVQQRSAQRRVTPVGAWMLFIFCCHWRITAAGKTLAHDESTKKEIEAALPMLAGQKLAEFQLDAATRITTFSYDLGGMMTTWPYEANEDEQWCLYSPDGYVLTYRADGCYDVGVGNKVPYPDAWHAVERSLRLP